MKLSVILVNWRNEAQTISRVAALRTWQSLNPQIWVVDNQSTDASRRNLEAVTAQSELLISRTNLGYGGGNNLAIRKALACGSDALMLLNSDADISEASTQRLLDTLTRHPEISILGPAIKEKRGAATYVLGGGRDIARFPATRMEISPEEFTTQPRDEYRDVDYVPGAVFLARAQMFRDVGLFDETYFFSGEIADLCKRAAALGHRVCVDLNVAATHDTNHAEKMRNTLYGYYNLRNRFIYIRKHHRTALLWYLTRWTGIGVAQFGVALAKGNFSKARAVGLGLVHGLTGRHGDQNDKFI